MFNYTLPLGAPSTLTVPSAYNTTLNDLQLYNHYEYPSKKKVWAISGCFFRIRLVFKS